MNTKLPKKKYEIILKKNILKKKYETMLKKRCREFRFCSENKKNDLKIDIKLKLKFLDEKQNKIIVDDISLNDTWLNIIKQISKQTNKKIKKLIIKKIFNKQEVITPKNNFRIISILTPESKFNDMELSTLFENFHKIEYIKGKKIRSYRKIRG